MKKKKIVIALGHEALGTTLPEQKEATKRTAKAVADFIREDYQVVITHSNGPQIGMIHTAMNEFCKLYPEYTATPMSVCSAMSQGYIGYDLQNAIRAELLNKGIYKPVSTILTQVVVDPYDEAFYKPSKVIGRVLTEKRWRKATDCWDARIRLALLPVVSCGGCVLFRGCRDARLHTWCNSRIRIPACGLRLWRAYVPGR